jgi:hypothetical protein
MNKLLKEAIADAKAVRETALANAKIALEEAFTPRLQSMLSARLAEEAEEEDMYEEEMEAPEPDMTEEGAEEYYDTAPAETQQDAELEEDEEEDDLDLEEIIRELEGSDDEEMEEDLDSSDIGAGDNKVDKYSTSTEDPGKRDHDGISIEEIIEALREAEGDEDMEEEPVTEGEDEEKDVVKEGEGDDEEESAKVEEAYRVIKFLKNKINEVNLLNAKLLFSNKLFRNFELNESQKMKVIENFDRASNLREVKLVFSTICESLTVSKNNKKQNIKESYASKPVRSTAPKKEILSESTALAARWKKLANL